ncbi:hypothetical protein LLB_0780 [Legionella longbeachae D-4968]|nr:hypothetical protein LLB_0780 [Legionella longbeachae D-4968]
MKLQLGEYDCNFIVLFFYLMILYLLSLKGRAYYFDFIN